jgi:hypothetical protein
MMAVATREGPRQFFLSLAGITREAMRDRDDGFGAAGESHKLQRDESSEDEFSEVHCF